MPFDHYGHGTLLLPDHWRQGTNFMRLLKALLGDVHTPVGVTEAELVSDDLQWDRWIANGLVDSAVGWQLDRLGTIVKQQRGDDADDTYRRNLKLAVCRNTAQGLAEQLIAVVTLMLPPVVWVQIVEGLPAHIYLTIQFTLPLPTTWSDDLQPLAPMGVGLHVSESIMPTVFGFEEDPLASGFDEVDLMGVPEGIGGCFAELLPKTGEV
jgi:hypothetical protein